MEKKLKINFILKGIAVFAFVAFCLLAILAGVTLPFVSNASTVDCAVANAESDCAIASTESNTFNLLDFCIPLSQCNTTDTYYGFYITQDFYNFMKTYTFDELNLVMVCEYKFISSESTGFCTLTHDTRENKNCLKGTMDSAVLFDIGSSIIPYNYTNVYFLLNQGFNFTSIESNTFNGSLYVFNQLPFGGDTTELENQIATLTAEKNALQAQLTEKQNQIETLTAEKATLQSQLTEKQNQIETLTAEKATLQAQLTEKDNQIETLIAEKNALQTQVNELTAEKNTLQTELNNIKFQSVFGYIGDLKNNIMYFNTHSVPIIPEDIYCPYRNNNLVNYNKIGNDYYLSIVDAYDTNGNIVTDAFSGWKFTNKLNPDNTPSSFYDFEFFIRDLRVCHIDTVQFVDNCFTTPNYNNIYYTVDSYLYDGGVWAYSSAKTQYLYALRSYLTKDDVRDFFALFEYRNYVPFDDAAYLAGFNAASKGYYNDGYNEGYSVGEDVGYNTGFSAGDAQGYARGVEAANTYSFLGLFGAIFDAPIKAIFGGTSTLPAGTTITDSNGNTITLQSTTTVNRAGLLNFNLMGVNLSGFVLALFSLSILVVVIKFALAKGR